MHSDIQERPTSAAASVPDKSLSETPAVFAHSSGDTRLPVEQPTKQTCENLAESPLLARMGAPAAQALNRIYTWTSPLAFRLRDSEYRVWWDDAAKPAVPSRSYRFQLGSAKGWLTLEALAERELLSDAAADAVPESLRCILLADALAPLFSTVENHTRRTIELLPESDEEPAACKQIGSVSFRVSKLGTEYTQCGSSVLTTSASSNWICPPPRRLRQCSSGNGMPCEYRSCSASEPPA
jgi:hypothetical protein